jgi:hypothetical protein
MGEKAMLATVALKFFPKMLRVSLDLTNSFTTD